MLVCICNEVNCNEPARYGKVNEETGMFEQKHCKTHKQTGETGQPPDWKKRYNDFKKICSSKNYKLITTEEEWIRNASLNYKPKMLCLQGHIVTNTSIANFVNHNRKCYICNGTIPWSKRYEEFKKLCNDTNYELITNEEEWKIGTKEKKVHFKPIIMCLEGHIVNNTDINSFYSGRRCFQCQGVKKWSERYEEFKEKCISRGYKLITTEEEWEIGTKTSGAYFKPIMKCPEGHNVNNTDIHSFDSGRGCFKCTGSLSWENRYPEFKNKCIDKGYELITTEEDWKIGTKQFHKEFKPIMKCKKGHRVSNTTIHSFVNNNSGCPKCYSNYSKKQIIWLNLMSLIHGINIKHAENGGEEKINGYCVDGYCEDTNTAFEFHGDFWHGNPDLFDKKDINRKNNKFYGDLYNKTIDKENKIKEAGCNLVVMWENDWNKINNSIKILQRKWRNFKK